MVQWKSFSGSSLRLSSSQPVSAQAGSLSVCHILPHTASQAEMNNLFSIAFYKYIHKYIHVYRCRTFKEETETQREERGWKEEETAFTSETCWSTSLRRCRTLDMKWIAEWQDGGGAGASRSSGRGWNWASLCFCSTCLSLTREKG